MPGYAGGAKLNPTYEQVCNGTTGHAEVIQVEYDPTQISYEDLLTVFFAVHDPTTLNKQGNDVGTQYRSIILFTTDEQKKQAQKFIKKLSEDEFRGRTIVTEIRSLDTFYPAEEYHRKYYRNNPNQSYCQLIIDPKVEKLKKKLSSLLKTRG